MIDQTAQLKKISEVRQKIHSLCEKSKCVKYPRCKKLGTVCTNDNHSPFRKVIRNNGGNFEEYLRLRTELMNQNYPLVISIAHGMGGYSTDDLCQEGMLGLCEAIDRFDLSYGNKFSTYAFAYIKKAILEFIRENQTVRLATRISYLSKITEEAFDNLTQKKKYRIQTVTSSELLKEVLRLRKKKKMGNMTIRPQELEGHLGRLKLQLGTVEIQPIEPNKFEYQEHEDSFYQLLNKQVSDDLSDKSIWVSEAIKLRFGLGIYTHPTEIPEISSALGITQRMVEYSIKKFFEKEKV